MRLLVFVWALAALVLSTVAHAEWVHRQADIMGTRVSVSLWHTDQARGEALAAQVMQEMKRIDNTYSPYRETSELSRLNREAAKPQAVNKPIAIDAEMTRLLDKSLFYGRLTDGAFDITFASVGRYYDYRAGKAPSDSQAQQLAEAIDYRHVVLDKTEQSVYYQHPAVYIDLGGIAKGYAVDRAIELLENDGVQHASVSAGGDSRVLGDRRGRPWMVGIKKPRGGEGVAITLPLTDTAISTSGDYERYFINEDGDWVHHIINPQTGKSTAELASVTIIGPRGFDTDALSTSVFVLGADEGLALINRLSGFDAVIITRKGKVHYSDGLAAGEQ
ncbi:FAD:protein FMN transferase [Gilvimarinus xylanilyticus]|uniref:FAD:protein FMN transferase n=1 Tax=Gilvimarinus xylanilyticus TaxID=2944139 RepID=A0A9X2KTB0_9GAMM|nr:FAD:protein FMN transferase [Gilvimarinus xylanilyticus]MCP8899726.1 FAD:protein FMN transferase [Gilvimarinus xylanilyticus]